MNTAETGQSDATHTEASAEAAGHPYARLTPDVVMDALRDIGLWGDGRLQALNSFENRVYQAGLDEPVVDDRPQGLQQAHHQVVLKFYRPERWTEAQIREEHAFSEDLVAAEVPVVAPLRIAGDTLHRSGDFWFSVCPRKGGRRPELEDLDVLEWIGRFLGRIHTAGASAPFAHRPSLGLASFAHEPRDWLLAHDAIAPEVRKAWEQALAEALDIIASHPSLLTPSHPGHARLHGDCHPGNVLWTPEGMPEAGPHFVDLDDARNGPPVQDLWMLLSGDRRQQTLQLSALLDGYEQVRDFDRSELVLIEPLRTLRLIHYSAWLARRWQDPAFPINFPWYGTRDYWQGQVDMLHEQIEAMQEPSLMV